MNEMNMVTIEQIPAISAIYYALLCGGYDFFAPEKPPEVIAALQQFAAEEGVSFFAAARQSSCEVYPYWPRAAILETASFCLKGDGSGYADFPALRMRIMSAGNIARHERGEALWRWLADFPAALREVLQSADFRRYSMWEAAWLARQKDILREELQLLRGCLERCTARYGLPMRRVVVALSPIKCAYAADYHLMGETFVFSSGRFCGESVVHEFLHPAVHAAVEARRAEVLRQDIHWPGVDASYYLDGGEAGRLNAFEEHCVRRLTAQVCRREETESLDDFVSALLHGGGQEEHHENRENE